eukprot:scaffold153462_cov16-Tisochrysis_lutea.AAC.2
MSSRQRWQLQQAAVITNMTSSHNLTCRTFYLCMLQRQRRQLQQRQRQQEIQKRPEGDEKQEPRLDQAHLQQEQRRRRLKIRQDDLPLQLSIPGQCYPPSLYSRVAPCSVQQHDLSTDRLLWKKGNAEERALSVLEHSMG